MKENIDIFRTIDITEDSLDALVDTYDCFLSKVSGRTRNVMRKWQMEFPDIRQFLIYFMESTYEEMKNIRSCGNLTLRDLHALQYALISAAQTGDSLSETYYFSKPVLQEELGLPESSDELLLKKKEALRRVCVSSLRSSLSGKRDTRVITEMIRRKPGFIIL